LQPVINRQLAILGRKHSAFLTSHKFVKADIFKMNPLVQLLLAAQGLTIITCLEFAGNTGLVAARAATPPPVRSEVTACLQPNSGPNQPETSPNIAAPVHLSLTFIFATPARNTAPANTLSNPSRSTIFCSALPRGPTLRL
jgi:hypothetical protein